MAISKVILNNQTLMDVTSDTVTPETLKRGETATMKNGTRTTGTLDVLPSVSSSDDGKVLIVDSGAWNAQYLVEEITISDSGEVIQTLDANKLYHFTGALSSLGISLNAPDYGIAQYHFDFDSGSTATTVALPSEVVMPSEQAFASSKHYEVDILNGYGMVAQWSI